MQSLNLIFLHAMIDMKKIIVVDIPKMLNEYFFITIIFAGFLYFLFRAFANVQGPNKKLLDVKYNASMGAAIATFLIVCNAIYTTILIYFVCQAYPRTDTDYDYLGLIVGILGVMVTLLLGWQIFSNISFKNQMIKMVEDTDKSLKQEIENKKNEITPDIEDTRNAAIAASLYQLCCSVFSPTETKVNKEFALQLALNAICYISRLNKIDETFNKEVYVHLVSETKKILNSIDKVTRFSQKDIDNYINALLKLNQRDLIRIISSDKFEPNKELNEDLDDGTEINTNYEKGILKMEQKDIDESQIGISLTKDPLQESTDNTTK